MRAPHLTIIIPTFQAEKTLQASLDSVLGQDFQDLEVLVMDGGSRDGTTAIVRQAALRDSRIRLISEPDKGVYDAMNKGIREAHGTWLYFLGSDDFLYDPKVFSAAFAFAGHDEADFLYGNVVSPSYKGVYDGQFDIAKLLLRNISHQAIFYRRTIFERIPAYNLRYKGYADWDLNIRIFMDKNVRVRYIGGTIARFGPDGLSSRHDILFLREVLFPAKLRLLQETGLRALRPVLAYDEWWRLLRNAEFRDAADLPVHIPAPVARMAAWQRNIPRGLLKTGFCSKILMFASYLSQLLTGALQ